MPATYEPIATTTLSSATTTLAFTSIAGTYTDLRVVVFVKASSAGAVAPLMQFNSDTGTNYSYTRITGDGTTAATNRGVNSSSIQIGTGSVAASGVGLWSADIFSYAGSTYKTVLLGQFTDANGSGMVANAVNMWRSTSAITRIDISAGNDFDIGTTATLYGILKA